MSSQPISSSSASATGMSLSNLSALTGLNSGGTMQLTGLASGLDTNSIISKLMQLQEQPVTLLTNQQKGLQALNSNLSGIQSSLQTLASDAQALADPSLFSNSQSVTSTNSTLVSASTTGSVGAAVGGYQVTVSTLATASQQTYALTPPVAADQVSVATTTGQTTTTRQYSLAAGATAQDLANAVNADGQGSVWATVDSNGNIVFSNRSTGNLAMPTITDATHSLSAQANATPGQQAQFSINGATPPQTSNSNTVTGAIPGVTLNLGGITTSPVTVVVGQPGANTSAVQTAVQNFITQYNSVLSQINTQLSQTPSASDPTQGTLYGDRDLSDLLANMRGAMITPGTGLTAGMATMMDIGVGTGAATGSATPSQNAINGVLTLNAGTLTAAIQNNPSGVQQVLQAWSTSFSSLVNNEAQAGGTLDTRIQGDDSRISELGNQITNMNAALADKQSQLQQQFSQLESALSQNQSTSAWLTSQIAALP